MRLRATDLIDIESRLCPECAHVSQDQTHARLYRPKDGHALATANKWNDPNGLASNLSQFFNIEIYSIYMLSLVLGYILCSNRHNDWAAFNYDERDTESIFIL